MPTFTTTTDLWVAPPSGGPLARLRRGAPVHIDDGQEYNDVDGDLSVYVFTTPDGFTGAASAEAFELVDNR